MPKTIRRTAVTGSLLAAAVALSGCGWWTGETREIVVQRGCPGAGILPDAAMLIEYQGPGRDILDVTYRWELIDAAARCIYDDNIVQVEYGFSLEVLLGPAARQSVRTAPVFIALTRGGETVIEKRIVEMEAVFAEGEGGATYTRVFDDMEFDVGEEDGRIYTIVVGFQLTPEQLAENRRRAGL